MGNKLYVGNLPFSASDDSLREMFGQAGQVESARIITDRDTGRSKGFGFVEMATEQEAGEAIKKFNGMPLEGRSLTVNEARWRRATVEDVATVAGVDSDDRTREETAGVLIGPSALGL